MFSGSRGSCGSRSSPGFPGCGSSLVVVDLLVFVNHWISWLSDSRGSRSSLVFVILVVLCFSASPGSPGSPSSRGSLVFWFS